MASRALCAALDHEADYPAETIVMQEADVGENEAAAMFEEVTGLGDGGVLNVNRRHVESVTLTPDAPVGPAERHNTVLRTLPPIAVASAHSTAPHARAANEVMLDAHGQRRGEVLGPISDDLLTSRGGSSGEPPPAGCGTYPPARRRRATSRLSFCARPNRRSSARTPHSSVRPTSHGASSSAGRRAGSPRPGWPQPPSAARRSAEPRASPASRRPPGRNSRLPPEPLVMTVSGRPSCGVAAPGSKRPNRNESPQMRVGSGGASSMPPQQRNSIEINAPGEWKP